jgi:large subunit ribosomal protein L31
MKPRIHPKSRPVVFRDRAAGAAFLTNPTAESVRRVEWEDGNRYPVIDVEIFFASHPFYTGTSRVTDTAGRIERKRFQRRYAAMASRG